MSHARKQIRDAVLAAVTGLAATADRVYPARAHALEDGHPPSLLVYTGPEQISGEFSTQSRPSHLLRDLDITVEGRASNTDEAALENALEQIAAEVEAALGTSAGEKPLGGLVLDMQIARIEPEIDGTGDTYKGAIRLEYSVQYRTAEDNAEAILD